MQVVQTLVCVNNAAFVMSFGIEILDMNTGKTLIIENLDSGNYPIDQSQSIDLSTIGIAEGTWLKPQVYAVWGDTNLGDSFVQYATNGETATYEVSGTTLNYSVRLLGAS